LLCFSDEDDAHVLLGSGRRFHGSRAVGSCSTRLLQFTSPA
jgi:hypothetical protein